MPESKNVTKKSGSVTAGRPFCRDVCKSRGFVIYYARSRRGTGFLRPYLRKD